MIIRTAFESDTAVVRAGVYLDDFEIVEGADIPPAIQTELLNDAAIALPYTVQLEGFSLTGGGIWSIQPGGTNDAWLSIDTDGVLSGTPSLLEGGPVSVTVRLASDLDPNLFDEVTFDFDVRDLLAYVDFEDDCAAWTLTGPWACGAPTSGPNAAFAGAGVLATNLSGDYGNDLPWDSATATATIDLAGTTAPVLQFVTWYNTEGSTYDGFNLRVSTDGINYTVLESVSPTYNLTIDARPAWGGNNAVNGYVTHVADLSAYTGETLDVQFSFRSDSSATRPGVYIDELLITD